MARNWIKAVVLGSAVFLAGSVGGPSARAIGDEPVTGRETLTQYLTPAILEMIFPGSEKVGEVDGVPPSAAVYKGGRQVGYLFSTWDVTQSKGFSDRPLILLVGLDPGGRITGARLVHHSEPMAVLGVPDEEFQRFAENYKGLDVRNGVDVVVKLSSAASSVLGQESFSARGALGTTDAAKVNAISRATTSSLLMSDAIVRGARIIARSRGILLSFGNRAARLDVDRFTPADWPELEAAGAIGHLRVLYGDVTDKLGQAAGAAKGADGNLAVTSDAVLVDFYVALLTPAGIGVNILGKPWYDEYTAGRSADDQVMLLAANGAYSFLGDGWERGDILDRVEISQGDRTIALPVKQIKTLPFLHAEKPPDLTERALVFFPGRGELDPTRAFQVNLLVTGATAAGRRSFASFALPYHLPDAYVLHAAADAPGGRKPDEPKESRAGTPPAAKAGVDWKDIWRGHPVKITVLVAALSTLTVILFLQNFVTRRPSLHRWIRIGFLSWTLVWLGWYAGAQLTVVNVIADIHALLTGSRWDFLLVDPLIAILSVFTLAGLFLWGRALFCGWLCPFGALQELVSMAARRFRVRQINIPIALHERLIALKYLLFLGLLAASFFSWDLAMRGADVEPFKAAIILRFMTEWPMVGYALALTAASVFVERFYCRFICPLGGGLSIFGRVRMFNWLKRHPECGTRCRICETVCPVGAIKRSGEIDMNECFYCLDCQVTYSDDRTCPPMIARRKRRTDRPPVMAKTVRLSTGTALQEHRR